MKVWKMNLYKLTHKKSFVAAVLYIFFFIFVSASSYSSTINSGDLDGWDILRNFDLGKYVKSKKEHYANCNRLSKFSGTKSNYSDNQYPYNE